jgi:hypothetical protein
VFLVRRRHGRDRRNEVKYPALPSFFCCSRPLVARPSTNVVQGQSEDNTPSSARSRRRLSGNPGTSRDESHHVLSHGPSPLTYAARDRDNADSTLLSSPPEGSQMRRQSTSTLANSMMRTVVSSGNDALNILFEAAAAHSKEHGNGLSESTTPSRNARNSTGRSNNYNSSMNQMHSVVPPEVLAKAARPVEISQASKEDLSVWGSCRFVRMGWFTAREAVTFIDLFVWPFSLELNSLKLADVMVGSVSSKTCHICPRH